MLRRFIQSLAFLQLLIIGSLGFGLQTVHAQEVTAGLNAVGGTINLPSTDPRIIATRIINVALGLIGIILVSIVIYAGFIYMTSGGNEEKITTAKKLLKNAVIGLIIILSAWAITTFVIRSLLQATNGDGIGGGGGSGGGGGFVGGGTSASFRVDSIVPSGNTPIRNVEVAVVFTRAVDPTTASAILVQEKTSGTTVAGTFAVSGQVVTFTPATSCPTPNQDRKCFSGDTDFIVRVGNTVKSTSGTPVSCAKQGSCVGEFHTGNLIDTQPPAIRVSFPTDGMSVPQDFAQDILADVTDDAGVKLAQFFDGQTDIGADAVPNGKPAPLSYSARIAWQTTGVALGGHTLSALAKDVDTNQSRSASVSVVVRGPHCFNQKLDQNKGETDIDCGGDPQSADYCGSCLGGSCQKNSDCASGVCQAGLCVAKPLVYAVSPLDGQPGTFVTVQGVNFGQNAGTITFLGNPNDAADDRVATAPAACSAVRTWTNYQAIVALPAGAAAGPIEITNVSSTLADRTDDTNGPKLADFNPNNSAYPGVCGIQPERDIVGAPVTLVGTGFGSAPSQILFGSEHVITSFPSWSDTAIRFSVPVVDNGPYDVAAMIGQTQSNVVSFSVLEKSLLQPPTITEIAPASGPQQQYVTVYGTNVGYDIGTVVFTDVLSGIEAVGDTSFPAECSNAFWRNDSVTIKVPSAFKNNAPTTPGSYKVKIIRRDGAVTNSLDFKIITGTPTPGLCAIVPAIGPADTIVSLYGEHFGLAKPSVTFFKNVLAPIASFKDQEVNATVPTNAITGRVKLTTSGALDSNTVGFQVKNCNEDASICGPANKFKCCPTGVCVASTAACGAKALAAEYGWNASTGLIPLSPRVVEECNPQAPKPPGAPTPSPAPWDSRMGGDRAPVDSVVTIRFDRPLGDRAMGSDTQNPVPPSTVTPSAFTLNKCTGTGSDVCATQEVVPFSLHFRAENNQQDVVSLEPIRDLEPSTVYSVTVASTIKADGPGGGFMEVMKKCGSGKNGETYGYCFKFKTRNSTEPTQIGDVSVYPNPYRMDNIGESTGYEAAPFAQDDRCVVLNCSKFGWEWYTGSNASSQDARASITNTALDGKVLCRQIGTGLQETIQVPVDINARVVQNNPITGTAQLYVNFVPPKVEDYAPRCDQACSNALIWARFSGAMDQQSVTNQNNIVVQKCRNENCIDSELGGPISIKKLTLTQAPNAAGGDVRERFLSITPSGNLESGGFYRVLLKGGPAVATGMKGKNGVPLASLNHPQGFYWVFRVKPDVKSYCAPTRIDVSPLQKFEYQVFASQLFLMTPYGPADSCSAGGQMLVTAGNTDWTTSKREVAALYKGGQLDTGAPLPKGCSNNCLATGATGRFGLMAMCGNGLVETTDVDYCVVRTPGAQPTTPRGTACTILRPGAAAGEQCEPSRDGLTLCNAQTCKFLPTRSVTSGGSCGNGIVEPVNGETCDFGTFCHYAADIKESAKTVAEGKPCENAADGADRVACRNAGGTCQPLLNRGCTESCSHAGAQIGGSTCGNSDSLGDGKDCDDGNRTDGDGCSSQCLHEGSSPATVVAAICGNGSLEPGETCEASSAGGALPQGCDALTCLHKGNAACNKSTDRACCGNGVMEYGEDCDDGNSKSGDGCTRVCLFEGSSAGYKDLNGLDTFAPAPSFCADGVIGTGEQCESGRSSEQIAGANGLNYSVRHAAAASVGADQGALRQATSDMLRSILGGQSRGDGEIDPIQLAYIEGDTSVIQQLTGSPNRVLDDQNRISSILGATYAAKQGTATYGLQCGFKDEAQCAVGMGLDAKGCCSQRPDPVSRYPTGTDVCRNVLINVTFNVGMDTGSVVNNFELLSPEPATGCPTSSKMVLIAKEYAPTISGKVRHAWDAFVEWITAKPAMADRWCSGTVTGQLRPQTRMSADGKVVLPPNYFSFRLDQALAPRTVYRLRFLVDSNLADNADLAKRVGIKSAAGVVTSDSPLWTFTTGDEICRINAVGVTDVTVDPRGEEHPYLYLNKNGPETRSFHAVAQALRNGVAVPLSPITNVYDWNWIAWTENSRGTLLEVVPPVDPAQSQPDNASFRAKEGGASGILSSLNGHVTLGANVKIVADSVSVPSTAGRVVQGAKDVMVMTCSNPWPTMSSSPFRDALSSGGAAESYPLSMWSGDSNARDLFLGTPPAYFNFSTAYCKDANTATSTADDLPQMKMSPVQPNVVDSAAGIFRQFLFTYDDSHPELKQDGIGIRILGNPAHLSPAEWYRSRGFTGAPASVVIDQYPAVQDGTSLYVAAANRPTDGGPIYSNIYLLSHNEGAMQTTKNIYEQMVAFLAFNINMKNQSNVCVRPTSGDGEPFVDGLGRTIPCTADWECLKFDRTLKCDSLKFKLGRDTTRLADFQSMSKTIEASRVVSDKNPAGSYPRMEGGTYLRNLTTSVWPSWKNELGSSIKLASMPVDPVNKLMACGRCSATQFPCQSNADCNKADKTDICQGGSFKTANNVTNWVPDLKIDPATCWNSDNRQFICPKLDSGNPDSVSRLYQYTAMADGLQYQIGAEFEVPPPMGNANASWWSPPLPTGVSQCVTPATLGKVCTNDADCLICANPANCKVCSITNVQCERSADCRLPNEACVAAVPVAGSCKSTGATFSYSGICRDIAISSEGGVCGDGVVNVNETCETGETRTAVCQATVRDQAGIERTVNGHQRQTCQSCTGYVPDPRAPQCQPDAVCGNGKLDGVCSNNAAFACGKDADCDGGSCMKEICDEGILNGSYGHCAKDCRGYGAYCGDGQLSPGEVCDNGTSGPNANGAYSLNYKTGGCSVDCRTSAPYCGNDKVDTGFEACEIGDTQRTQKAVCKYDAGGVITTGIPCDSVADCPAADAPTVVTCGGDVQTNSCVGVTAVVNGAVRNTQHVRECSDTCNFNGKNWSACVAMGTCGDGVMDGGEECDDGQGNGPTKRCTQVCKKNVCGDGNPYQKVEECDNGDDNGKPTCSSPYGASCLSCSNQCKFVATAGGYCGDGVKNGPEQCDANDGVYDPAQPCAAADPSCASDGKGNFFKRIACSDLGFDYGQVSCGQSTCRFAGCQTCADKVGVGVITGQVFDSIYDDQPVPRARITLLSRGVRIDQTIADVNGRFSFTKLNEDTKCGVYKIVVDSYDNNSCTDIRDQGRGVPGKCNGAAWPTGRLNIDESQNNGYWPYSSQSFSGNQASFADGVRNKDAKIYITPRSSPYETTVVVRWEGDLTGHLVDAHLYIPKGMAFTASTIKACSLSNKPCGSNPNVCLGYGDVCTDVRVYSQCSGIAGENCLRDVHYGYPGGSDLSKRPYSRLFCDGINSNCTFPSAPQTMKFTRKYGSIGQFSFYLDDVSQYFDSRKPGKNYNSIGLTVEASTDSSFVQFEPQPGQCAKAWNVFTEEVSNGSIRAPAKPWQGVRFLPTDLLIGTSACKVPGTYCDDPGYPREGVYPNQEYKMCDDPMKREDADSDSVWDGIDACSGVECAANDSACIAKNACPAGDTMCTSNTCPAGSPYCKPDSDMKYLGCAHPDIDRDGVWGDGLNGPDVCPTKHWSDGCALTNPSNPMDPIVCQDKNNPGCPNSDPDDDGVSNIPDRNNIIADDCPLKAGTPQAHPYNGCPIKLNPVALIGDRDACKTTDEVPRASTCCKASGSSFPYNDSHCSATLDKCDYRLQDSVNWRMSPRGLDVCASMAQWDFWIDKQHIFTDSIGQLFNQVTVGLRPLQYAATYKGFNTATVGSPGGSCTTAAPQWTQSAWNDPWDPNTLNPVRTQCGGTYTHTCDEFTAGRKYIAFEPSKVNAENQPDPKLTCAAAYGDSIGERTDSVSRAVASNPALCPNGGNNCWGVSIGSWINHYKYLVDWADYDLATGDNKNIGYLTHTSFNGRAECRYQKEIIEVSDADNCVASSNDRTDIVCAKCKSIYPNKTKFNVASKIIEWCNLANNRDKCMTSPSLPIWQKESPVRHLYRPEVCTWLRQEQIKAFNAGAVNWTRNGGASFRITTSMGIADTDLCVQLKPGEDY